MPPRQPDMDPAAALNAMIGISQPVHSQAAEPIAQFFRNCLRFGPRSAERSASATINAMSGKKTVSSTAPVVAPLPYGSSPMGPVCDCAGDAADPSAGAEDGLEPWSLPSSGDGPRTRLPQ